MTKYDASNSLFSALDRLSSLRFSFGNAIYKAYGLNLLGQNIPTIVTWEDFQAINGYGIVELDNMYMSLALRNGLLYFISFLSVYFFTSWLAFKQKDTRVLVIMVVLLVFGMFEVLGAYLQFNTMFFMLGYLIKNRQSSLIFSKKETRDVGSVNLILMRCVKMFNHRAEPILSVIVPVYNPTNTLPRLIRSIYAQDYLDLTEIIFIDDGSTDGSVSIIEEMFSQGRAQMTILRQPNLKQAKARNHGLKYAKGKYALFIDSDDELPGNTFKNYIDTITQKCPEFIFGLCLKEYTNGTTQVESPFSLALQDRKQLINSYLTKNNESDVLLSNKCFSLKKIHSLNLNFSNGNFFEDSLFVFKFILTLDLHKV